MKKSAFILFLVSLPVFCYTQQTVTKLIKVDDKNRSCKIYIPASYDPGIPTPVVFSFHGYTDDANTQLLYRDFRPVADTAGFLIVCPQGTEDDQHNTHWNVGQGHSTVDDVHFIDVLIDSLKSQFNIDNNRLYSAGFSNGGMFSLKLGCELSHRIAAVASVGGPFLIPQDTLCHPQHPIPVMYIHGTTDGVVPYNGNATYKSALSTVEFWSTFNATQTIDTFPVPNINTTDNCTAVLYTWSGGTNGAAVQHYKVITGGHAWPGSTTASFGYINQDFNASEKIWQFFNQYDLYGATQMEIDCNHLNVTGITADTANPGNWLVTINFSSPDKLFINYPHVQYITNAEGDTLATGILNFFGQFSNTSQDYAVTSSLDSLPIGQEMHVFFYFNNTSCSLPFFVSGTKENLTLPGINIFPNPFRSETTVVLDKFHPGVRVSLFNSLGQIENPVIENQGDRFTLYRNGLPAGLHFLVISTGGESLVRKILILD